MATDQRGATRPFDGNKDGTARCDIGAFEVASSPGDDFNGDLQADVLWRHTSGATWVWLLNGATSPRMARCPPSIPRGRWPASEISTATARPISSGGTPPGLVYIWLMNGTSIIGIGSPGSVGDSTGLSRGSATSTVTARPTSSGGTAPGCLYLAHERHEHHRHGSPGSVGPTGRSWASATSTATARPISSGGIPPGGLHWLLNGTSIIGTAHRAASPPTGRSPDVGDFNGDGKADILGGTARASSTCG